MGSEEQPSWYTGGPYLLVGLPRVFDEFVPLNASSLVREWESTLDPLQALNWPAQEFLFHLSWAVGDKFVTPTYTTLEWLRRSARDEQITAVFAKATGDVLLDGDVEPAEFKQLVEDDERDGGRQVLTNKAMPVLLGLAVLSAVGLPLGIAGAEIYKRLPTDIQARVDQQRLEDDDRRSNESRREDRDRDRAERERLREQEAEFFRERGLPRPPGHDEEQSGANDV